jgi:hypothetical protein
VRIRRERGPNQAGRAGKGRISILYGSPALAQHEDATPP